MVVMVVVVRVMVANGRGVVVMIGRVVVANAIMVVEVPRVILNGRLSARCHAPNVFGTVDMEKVSQ